MSHARETLGRCGLVLLLGLGPSCVGEAQTASAAQDASDQAQADSRAKPRRIEYRGRLVVRGALRSEAGESSTDPVIDDARLEVRLLPARWMRVAFEADAADKRRVKDAYVRLRGGPLTLNVGQFKPPASAVQLESRWDLPTAERGLLNEVLVEAMGIAGRRPGVALGLERRGRWDVDARVGLFRSSHVRGDRIGDEAFNNFNDDHALSAQTALGRLTLGRRRLEVGVFGQWRPSRPLSDQPYERHWVAGADLTWRDRRRGAGRRVWGDLFVGSNWQDDDAFDGESSTFVAARAIGAWRRGGRRVGLRYLEPYVALGIVDPSTRHRADHMWEVCGGVNWGFWDRLRLSLEARHRRMAENAPQSLGIFMFGRMALPPSSRTELVVQLGGHF